MLDNRIRGDRKGEGIISRPMWEENWFIRWHFPPSPEEQHWLIRADLAPQRGLMAIFFLSLCVAQSARKTVTGRAEKRNNHIV